MHPQFELSLTRKTDLWAPGRRELQKNRPEDRPLPIQIREQDGVGFYALPEVAETEIFVGAVLVVVVVDDGDADPGEAELFEDVHGDAAAEHGIDYGLIVGGFLHDAD